MAQQILCLRRRVSRYKNDNGEIEETLSLSSPSPSSYCLFVTAQQCLPARTQMGCELECVRTYIKQIQSVTRASTEVREEANEINKNKEWKKRARKWAVANGGMA